jgi:predicted nucleotidyltransferase
MEPSPAALADLMIERARRDLEARGRTVTELRAAVSQVLGEVLAAGTARRAWLIGSLASGDFGEGSDIDVVTEGLPRDGEYAVRRALEDATRRQVDLLRLEELPESFREAVLRDGVPLP